MKVSTCRNLFEFTDTSYESVYENVISSIGQFQCYGLPDICYIGKYQQQNLKILNNASAYTGGFHFVQGLCPQSQAEVSAYMQEILNGQEKSKSSIFINDVNFVKITYMSYDMFSKTMLISQFEQPSDSLSQFKTFGVTTNRNLVQLTKHHWDGSFVTSVLKSLDSNTRMPSLGKCFNNQFMANPTKLQELIKKLLICLESYQQTPTKVMSKTDFVDVDEVLYYLCYPLHILCKYLEQSKSLEVLMLAIKELEQNTLFILLHGVLLYKVKKYKECIVEMSKLSLNQARVIQIKAMIKDQQFYPAYGLLQELILASYDNVIVWVIQAQLFRKIKQYQLSLYMLNKAVSLPQRVSIKQLQIDMQLQNYRLLCKQNIQQVNFLDKIYKIVHPIEADRLESYVQLSGFPNIDNILIRSRNVSIKKDYKYYENIFKIFNKPEYRVNQSTFDCIMNNNFIDELQLENNPLYRELIKLISDIGNIQKCRSLMTSSFILPHKNQHKEEPNFDLQDFSISFPAKMGLKISIEPQTCTNKSLQDARLNDQRQVQARSIDEIDDMESDEEKPKFLRNKPNKSFDFGNCSIKSYATPQNKKVSQSIISPVKAKMSQSFKKQHTIIVENAFESMESERLQFKSGLNVQQANNSEAPKSGEVIKPEVITILSPKHFIQSNISQSEMAQLCDQLLRRKELLYQQFHDMVDQMLKQINEIETLFYTQTPIPVISNVNAPQIKSPQFKSNLKKTLQTKQHLERQPEFKDFYITPSFEFMHDSNNKEQQHNNQIKSETMFMYKCARLAGLYKRRDLAVQIYHRINSKIISVQTCQSLLLVLKDNPKMTMKTAQRVLSDYVECSITKISQIPLWLEAHLVAMTHQYGANVVLGLLATSDTDFTFYLIKRVILQAENLA